MVLNKDCMRAVLLQIENLSIEHDTNTIELNTKLPDFTKNDVVYSCIMLKDAGYIEANVTYAARGVPTVIVRRMTFQGHEFLDTIRDNDIWAKTKTVAQKAGATAVSAFAEIAKALIKDAVTATLSH